MTPASKGLLVLAISALVAVVSVRYLLGFGGTALLLPDSVSYISVARNLLAGEGLVLFDGSPINLWPPGYPIALASLGLLGLDPLSIAGPLNTAIFGSIALTCGLWLGYRTRSVVAGLIAAVTILISRPLWAVSIYALSEPLFALLVLWSLIILQRHIDGQKARALLVAALLAALAVLTRYVGVLLVLAGVISLLTQPRINWSRKLKNAVAFAVIPGASFIAWWIWVSVITQHLGGKRPLAEVTLGEIIFSLGQTLANWGLPWSVDTYPKLLILTVIAAGVAVTLLWGNLPRTQERTHSSVGAAAFGWFVVVYTVGTVGVLTVLHNDRLGDRLLSPVYAPLAIWILSWVWNRLQTMADSRHRKLSAAVLVLLFAVWTGRSATVTGGIVEREHLYPSGFTSNRWRESDTIAYLQEHPPEALLYSNIPYPVYIYASLRVHRSPRRHWFGAPNQPTRDLAEFHDTVVETGEIIFVWFDQDPGAYQFSPEDLQEYFRLEPIIELSDGKLFRVTVREQGGAPVDSTTDP
jgi:4-amino-4-deoxy-L-arabinose transferase-like glycosyltransferase